MLENETEFKEVKDIADGVIAYLAKNYDNFRFIDLLVKCERNKIPKYDKILCPTIDNYLTDSDTILTRIVKLYDENFVVNNGIVINLSDNNNNRDYVKEVADALDKIN